MTTAITEEMGVHEKWYERANAMTLAGLPEFLRELTEDYTHDYGTICHAVAAGAVAAARAIDRSPTGGITGFQAGCIMWEFVRRWLREDNPLRLVNYGNMLYPQYERYFAKLVSADTWKWLQERATGFLSKETAHDDVFSHWKRIAEGRLPWGYEIGEP